LLCDQIHRNRCHVGSILDESLHSGGKDGHAEMGAVGILFLLGPIFARQQTRRGQIHHLMTLSSIHCHHMQVVQVGFAPFDLLEDNLIWRGQERQAQSLVYWLFARFLLALFAQNDPRTAAGDYCDCLWQSGPASFSLAHSSHGSARSRHVAPRPSPAATR